MCGILGAINIKSSLVESAAELLVHRGPDSSGKYSDGAVTFFNTRLSIQDVKNGNQPFTSGRYTIIFNGEIYNHLLLRKIHRLSCTTDSDTETLLQLYIRFGRSCLDMLDGMFAFAVYDSQAKTIFIARDRAGEKPLYYYLDKDTFCFASELNALRSLINPTINRQSIYQYLRYCIIDEHTPYEKVFELKPGTAMIVDSAKLEVRKTVWWNIEDYHLKESLSSNDDVLESLENMLTKSIRERIDTSDIEVGTFLSGGIDSGLITAIAASYKSNLKTFTVSFEGMYDESKEAAIVSKKYNTDHHSVKISFYDLEKDLEKIISNYGEPFSDSSAIPSYYISKAASNILKVVLTGDGADELFAGYRRYVPFAYRDYLKEKRPLRSINRNIVKVLPVPANKRTTYNYLYRLLELSGKNPLQSYLSSTINTFEGFEKYISGEDTYFSAMQSYIDYLNKEDYEGLQKLMLLDFRFQFPNDLLVKMDIASMANSIETRSPFLSKEILEYAPALPKNLKISGRYTKHILRRLATKYLPPGTAGAPKRGFEVPIVDWMDNRLNDIANDYLGGESFTRDFVDRKLIDKILSRKINVSADRRAKMLWNMLCLEIWHKKCYKNL